MIYIDNNTTGFTIPRITNGIGDKVILINQITKRRFELSTDVLNDVGYKVDITDLKLEIGQYDYVVKKNNIPLESGILQVGGYKSQNNQYEVDFNIIQYEPNIVYTPLPEKVLDVTENGVYNVESFDKVDVDVIDDDSREIIEGLEKDIVEKNFKISELQTKLNDAESENEQLEDEVSGLQSQIDSVTTLSVTENGIYTPEEGTLGWNNIEVNVEGGGGKIVLGDNIKLGYSSFTEVPDYFDFSQTTDFYSMFTDCYNLIKIQQLDTSNGAVFGYMFFNCDKLTTVSQLELSKGTSFSGMFRGCKSLKNVQFTGSINYSIDFDFSYNVTNPLNQNAVPYTTIGSILRACANTTNTNTKTLTLGSPAQQYPNLTYEGKTIREWVAECNSKGWTIIGMPTIMG